MRLKLFLLLLLSAALPIMAQNTGLSGTVVDATSGSPIVGASIMLENQGIFVTTGPSGDFRISNATAGDDRVQIVAYGYQDIVSPISITNGAISNMGVLRMNTSLLEGSVFQDDQDFAFDQSDLDDDEGTSQSITTLTGASDSWARIWLRRSSAVIVSSPLRKTLSPIIHLSRHLMQGGLFAKWDLLLWEFRFIIYAVLLSDVDLCRYVTDYRHLQ